MDTERSLELSFNGRTVKAAPLLPSQFTALQMMQHRGSEERAQKANLRMYRILEKSVGPDEWERLMDDLADGVNGSAMADLVESLIKGSVAYLTKPAPEPTKTDGDDMAPLSNDEVSALEAKLASLKAQRGE